MALITKGDTSWRLAQRGNTAGQIDFTAGSATSTGVPSLSLGQWYHVVCVYQGGSALTYINGNQAPGGTSTLSANNDPVLIGANWRGGPSRFFDGRIDDVRIYSQALNAASVQNLMAGRDANDGGALCSADQRHRSGRLRAASGGEGRASLRCTGWMECAAS